MDAVARRAGKGAEADARPCRICIALWQRVRRFANAVAPARDDDRVFRRAARGAAERQPDQRHVAVPGGNQPGQVKLDYVVARSARGIDAV